MASEDDAMPGIIIPGQELRTRIEKSAASLAKRDKRKAEEMMAKVLASPKREEFLYFELTHVFYPFFLQKLNEYRAHPELIPTDEKKDQAQGTGAQVSAVPTTTTVKAGGIVRREGGTAPRHDPTRDGLLRQAEMEAQLYLEDPFPNRYSLDLVHGTVDMSALTLSYMTCTAQYVAKYGDQFLRDILGRYRNNPAFRFLSSEDVRHGVFMKLVEAYRLILNYDPDDVENRLERYQSVRYVLDTVCEEKVKYAKAAIARRKAALLTDEELREKLEWDVFTVVGQFSLSDLGLEGPVPQSAILRRNVLKDNGKTAVSTAGGSVAEGGAEAAAEVPSTPSLKDFPGGTSSRMLQPPEGVKGPPTFTPTFMNSSLVASTDPTAPLSRGRRTRDDVEVGGAKPETVAHVRHKADHFARP